MKILKIFTAVCLCFALLIPTVAASAEISVSFPDKNAITDGKYLVRVDISDNPGFASLQIELFYNENTLVCEKVITGDVVRGMLADFNPKATGERTSAILSIAGISNTVEDGSLATFVFESPGDGDPRFDFVLVEIMTANGKKVECEITVTDNYGGVGDTPPPEEVESEEESTTEEVESEEESTTEEVESEEESTTEEVESEEESTTEEVESEEESTTEEVESEEESTTEEVVEIAAAFTDMDNHWASDYVKKAASLGIVNGLPDGTFAPDKEMTRAEFATLLWNMEKKPNANNKPDFTDVTYENWFYRPIAWAFENGYINGVSESEFDPNGKITREQAMTILYRHAGKPETSEALDKFADKDDVSDFAKDAMRWAVENKIISGVSENELAPKASATRAQLATIIVRYIGK